MSYSLGTLGATQYVIPSGGTFTGMFNVRGLASGQAAAASSAIGVEVRSIRGVSFTNVGWGAGRDAGVVVASGIVSSDTVPGVLLGKLRDAAVRAKARIPGNVTIDTTIRHVPTVARETTSSTPSPTPGTAPPTIEEPFSVLGMPLWVIGLLGVGVVVGGVLLLKRKKPAAPVSAPASSAPTLAKNRRRRNRSRRVRRNYSFSSWRGSRRSALPSFRKVN